MEDEVRIRLRWVGSCFSDPEVSSAEKPANQRKCSIRFLIHVSSCWRCHSARCETWRSVAEVLHLKTLGL